MKIILYIAFVLAFISLNDARKGNAAYNEGNYAAADSLYRIAIEQEPENANLYFNLGNALAKQGKVEEAMEAYLNSQEYAESDREKALIQYNIGTLLSEQEEWKPAAHHFRNSLQLNGNDVDAKHNFELATLKAKEKEEEEKQDDQSQNKPPEEPTDYAKAMKKRAEQLVAEKRYEEAFNLMQEALNLDETVQNYNDFIARIDNVKNIDN